MNKRRELTDVRIEALAKQYDCHSAPGFKGFARAAIAAHEALNADAGVMRQALDAIRTCHRDPNGRLQFDWTAMAKADVALQAVLAESPTPPAEQQGDQMPVARGRESVDDALAIVESFGHGTDGLNDTFARQIILADEVKRLRGLYESAVQGRRDFRKALREQQGEQEPVAWRLRWKEGSPRDREWEMWSYRNEAVAQNKDQEIQALYTHPDNRLAELRAKVEGLQRLGFGEVIFRVDVLALIDKAMGEQR